MQFVGFLLGGQEILAGDVSEVQVVGFLLSGLGSAWVT